MGRVSLHQSLTPAAVRDKLRAECLQRVQQHRDSLLWQLRTAAAEGQSAQDILESVIDRVVEDMSTCGTVDETMVCTPAHRAGNIHDEGTAVAGHNLDRVRGSGDLNVGTTSSGVVDDCGGFRGSNGAAVAESPVGALLGPSMAGVQDPNAGFATPQTWRASAFGGGGGSSTGGEHDTPGLPSVQGTGNRGETERSWSQGEKRMKRAFPHGVEPPYCPNEDIELLLMMERALYEDVLRVQAEAAASDERAAVDAMLETHLGPIDRDDAEAGCAVPCPVCLRANLAEHCGVIACPACRLMLDLRAEGLSLEHLRSRLADAFTSHCDSGCGASPAFAPKAFERGGPASLLMSCAACGALVVIA